MTTEQFRQQDLTGRLDPLPPTPAQIRAWAVEITEALIDDFAVETNPDLWQSIPHRLDDEGNVIRCRPGDTDIVDAVRAELRKIASEVTRRG